MTETPEQATTTKSSTGNPAKRRAALVTAIAISILLSFALIAVAVFAFVINPVAETANKQDLSLQNEKVANALNHCAIDKKFVKTLDGGNAMTVDGVATTGGPGAHKLTCFLDQFGAPEVVTAKFNRTRAIDGTITETWDGYEATWNYHPDNGLSIVIERI